MMDPGRKDELVEAFEELEEGLGDALFEDDSMLQMVVADMDSGTQK